MTSSQKRGDRSRTTVTPPVKDDEEQSAVLTETDLKGDWANLFLLILLYTMQGLPLGLSSCMPIFLQTYKNLSFQDQVRPFYSYPLIVLRAITRNPVGIYWSKAAGRVNRFNSLNNVQFLWYLYFFY